MGIRINVTWWWLRLCRNTYQFHKNRSEPMRIVSKLIGDMLGMRQVQTGHIPYHSQGCYKWWKWGNATLASSQRMWREKHLYGTGTAKTAWSSGQTSRCHHHQPQWADNGSCEQESKNNVHDSVYGALITGSRIGIASFAHAGLWLGFGIALVPVQETWGWMAMRSTIGSANLRGSSSGGSGPGRPSGMPWE